MVCTGSRHWYASHHPDPAKRGTTVLLAFAASPMPISERGPEDAALARGAETYATNALIYCEMDGPTSGSSPWTGNVQSRSVSPCSS